MVIQYILVSKDITMGVVGGSKFIIILSSTTLSYSFTIPSTSFTTHSSFLTPLNPPSLQEYLSHLSLKDCKNTTKNTQPFYISLCFCTSHTNSKKTTNPKFQDQGCANVFQIVCLWICNTIVVFKLLFLSILHTRPKF